MGIDIVLLAGNKERKKRGKTADKTLFVWLHTQDSRCQRTGFLRIWNHLQVRRRRHESLQIAPVASKEKQPAAAAEEKRENPPENSHALSDVKFATQIVVNFPSSPPVRQRKRKWSEIYDKKLQRLFDMNSVRFDVPEREAEMWQKIEQQQKLYDLTDDLIEYELRAGKCANSIISSLSVLEMTNDNIQAIQFIRVVYDAPIGVTDSKKKWDQFCHFIWPLCCCWVLWRFVCFCVQIEDFAQKLHDWNSKCCTKPARAMAFQCEKKLINFLSIQLCAIPHTTLNSLERELENWVK